MSGRGRARGGGRGGDGGRGGGGRGGPPRRDQPTPSPSVGRGGGGRGPTGPAVYQAPQLPSHPVAPTPSVPSSSTSYLSREVEQKLTIEAPVLPVHQPEKLAEAVQQPVSDLPPASRKSYRIPARPGYGKEGQKCIVRANHFLVKVADRDLHHYDVRIAHKHLTHNTSIYIICIFV